MTLLRLPEASSEDEAIERRATVIRIAGVLNLIERTLTAPAPKAPAPSKFQGPKRG